jgi:hypothetical protein
MAISERGNALWLKEGDEWMKREFYVPCRSTGTDETPGQVITLYSFADRRHADIADILFNRSWPQEQHRWLRLLQVIRYGAHSFKRQ